MQLKFIYDQQEMHWRNMKIGKMAKFRNYFSYRSILEISLHKWAHLKKVHDFEINQTNYIICLENIHETLEDPIYVVSVIVNTNCIEFLK